MSRLRFHHQTFVCPAPAGIAAGVASYRPAVNPLLTSVVREICPLRSVGAGERATAVGHPVGAQRWASLPGQLSFVINNSV